MFQIFEKTDSTGSAQAFASGPLSDAAAVIFFVFVPALASALTAAEGGKFSG